MSELFHWSDLVTVGLHGFIEPISIMSNLYLLFIILKYTPSQMKIYSCLILYHAFFDILSSFSLLMSSPRFVMLARARIYVFHGFCQYFGAHMCYVWNDLMVHGLSHCLISIVASFCFRYYILVKKNPELKEMLTFLLVLWTPSVFQFVTFYLAESEPSELLAVAQDYPPYAEYLNMTIFSGNKDLLEWKTAFSNVYLGMGAGIVLPVTLVMRKLISAKISSAQSMSENTRRMHKNLLKVLLLQSVSPCIFTLDFIPFTVMTLGIYRHPIMENYIFGSCGMIPFSDAFINLFFVKAYRRAVFGHLHKCARFLHIRTNAISIQVTGSSASAGNSTGNK